MQQGTVSGILVVIEYAWTPSEDSASW